ncbi:hypothetical protein ACL02T_33445 [Pseudonocardia sp. RS010]|uniref:hypothetical protein n=1 Tax=Pseudonocardia sp. RS010 TaxID=3385979 RepID=UPI0039A1FA56
MPPVPQSAPHPSARPGSGHRHTTRCYWDLAVCGWHCPPPADPLPPPAAVVVEPAEPAPGAAPV